MDLVGQLRLHAARHPGRVALTFLDDGGTRTLTFAELLHDAQRIAARLRADLPFARRALLLHRPGPEFLAALCGCWIAGVTAVPTYPPGYRPGSRAADRFARLAADADPQAVLVDSAGLARAWQAGAGALPGVRWLATDVDGPVLGGGTADAGAAARGADEAGPALIQYTSGSTGTPRGVRLSHANLAANLASIARRFRSTPDQVIVSWLPPYHDMGLVGGLLPVLAFGNPLVQMAPSSFVAQPLRWLRAIAGHGGARDGVVSGGPNFAFELCVRKLATADVAGLDLSGWRVAFCGAETVRPETLRRFAALLAPTGFDPGALLPCYGLAEATLLASGRFGLRTHVRDGVERTLCGPPADGVALAIVDDGGLRLEDGTPGEIWIAGAGVAAGYWGKDSADKDGGRSDAVTETAFGQRLDDDPRGWLRSGDLGYLHEGELVVTGRLKDLVILRGRNVYPADAEDAAARSHPALDPSGVAAFGIEDAGDEKLVLACELRRDSRHADPLQVQRAVQAALADVLELRAAHVLLLRPGALPRTTSGKISRSATRAAWLAGELAVVACPVASVASGMEQAGMEKGAHEAPLLAIAARLAGLPASQVDAGWTLGELGIDSLASVELLLALEHELGATVPAGCLAPDLSLRQLQALLVAVPPDAVGDLPARLPPSPQQLAFLEAGVTDPDAFIEIIHLRVPAAIDRAGLEGALAWLARRHPALRLRFVRAAGGWEAVTDGAPFALERLGAEQAGDGVAAWRQALLARIRAAIGIERGALAHAVWLDRGPLQNGMLVLALHHLVVDAASVAILVTGLRQAYTQLLAGRALPAAADGYAQWLLAQAAPGGMPSSAELDYWRAVCGAAGSRQIDPAACVEPGAQLRLEPEANRLFLARHADSATRRDALLAAFAYACMAQHGRADHALVRLEHHGRDSRLALPAAGAVGWMVSYYPLRIDAGGGTPAEQVEAVRCAHAAVPDRGAGYAAARRMVALREPELAFSYRGAVDESFRRGDLFPVLGVEHPGVSVWVEACARNGTLPVLDAQASLVGGTLVCTLAHQPARLPVETVRAIAAWMEAFLLALLD